MDWLDRFDDILSRIREARRSEMPYAAFAADNEAFELTEKLTPKQRQEISVVANYLSKRQDFIQWYERTAGTPFPKAEPVS